MSAKLLAQGLFVMKMETLYKFQILGRKIQFKTSLQNSLSLSLSRDQSCRL